MSALSDSRNITSYPTVLSLEATIVFLFCNPAVWTAQSEIFVHTHSIEYLELLQLRNITLVIARSQNQDIKTLRTTVVSRGEQGRANAIFVQPKITMNSLKTADLHENRCRAFIQTSWHGDAIFLSGLDGKLPPLARYGSRVHWRGPVIWSDHDAVTRDTIVHRKYDKFRQKHLVKDLQLYLVRRREAWSGATIVANPSIALCYKFCSCKNVQPTGKWYTVALRHIQEMLGMDDSVWARVLTEILRLKGGRRKTWSSGWPRGDDRRRNTVSRVFLNTPINHVEVLVEVRSKKREEKTNK